MFCCSRNIYVGNLNFEIKSKSCSENQGKNFSSLAECSRFDDSVPGFITKELLTKATSEEESHCPRTSISGIVPCMTSLFSLLRI